MGFDRTHLPDHKEFIRRIKSDSDYLKVILKRECLIGNPKSIRLIENSRKKLLK